MTSHVRLVAEIGALRTLGIPVDEARPFIECLIGGHTRGDDCPDSLGAYRRALDDLDERIDLLSARREALATEYRALALPMMIVFQNGQPIKTLFGAKPKAALEAELAPYLG